MFLLCYDACVIRSLIKMSEIHFEVDNMGIRQTVCIGCNINS